MDSIQDSIPDVNIKYFIKNFFWIALFQIVIVLSGIFLNVIFSRYTTQEIFGNYNFLISIISLLSILSIPGLNLTVMRSLAKGKDGTYKKAVKLSLVWSLIGFPILLLIGGYYYLFEGKIIGIGLLIASIFFPLLYAPNTWIAFLKGKERFDIFVKYSIIQSVIQTLAIIIIILVDKGSLLSIFLGYLILQVTFNIIFYYKTLKFINNDIIDKGWKERGYKLSINNFISNVYNSVDKILIGIFLGPISLAIYVIASLITSQIVGSGRQAVIILYPKIFNTDQKSLVSHMENFTLKFLLLSSLIVLILMLIIPYIIVFLFSTKYVESIFFAQIYLIVIPFALLTEILTAVFISMNLENALVKIRIITSILLLILYLITIPLYGIWGAIISSIIYYILINLVQYYLLKRLNKS